MFNMTVSLQERHFMHYGKDCYYKIWVAEIEYAKTPDDSTTVESEQFNTRQEAIWWAINRARDVLTEIK